MLGVCRHEYDLPLNEVDEGTLMNRVGVAFGLTEDWRRLSIVYGSGHLVLHEGNYVWLRVHTIWGLLRRWAQPWP